MRDSDAILSGAPALPVLPTNNTKRARGAAKPLAEIEREDVPTLIANMAKVPKIDFGAKGKVGGMKARIREGLEAGKMRLPGDPALAEGLLDALADVTVGILDEHLASVRAAFQLRGRILVRRVKEADLVEIPLTWGEPGDESEVPDGDA